MYMYVLYMNMYIVYTPEWNSCEPLHRDEDTLTYWMERNVTELTHMQQYVGEHK